MQMVAIVPLLLFTVGVLRASEPELIMPIGSMLDVAQIIIEVRSGSVMIFPVPIYAGEKPHIGSLSRLVNGDTFLGTYII